MQNQYIEKLQALGIKGTTWDWCEFLKMFNGNHLVLNGEKQIEGFSPNKKLTGKIAWVALFKKNKDPYLVDNVWKSDDIITTDPMETETEALGCLMEYLITQNILTVKEVNDRISKVDLSTIFIN